MYRDIKELLSIFGYLFAGVIFFITCLIIIGTPIIYADCSNKSELYKTETKFDIVSGCFVKNGDTYVPLKLFEKSMMEVTNINVMTPVEVE